MYPKYVGTVKAMLQRFRQGSGAHGSKLTYVQWQTSFEYKIFKVAIFVCFRF